MEKSWKDAVIRVLREADGPLHYTEIADQILSRGYYEPQGATPAYTVASLFTTSLSNPKEESPFLRVGRGIYALKGAKYLTDVVAPVHDAKKNKLAGLSESDVERSDSTIRSFGMYWQRNLVAWRKEPKILGKQQALSKPIDFCKQKGIYILYDHHTVVYIGRSIDRSMGRRFYEHTTDRLAGRWNRFSWFGLLDVTEEGGLSEPKFNLSLAGLVATLESLLIEAFEPPQNRRRGDDFSGIEYLQVTDPEIEEREILNTIRTFEQKLRNKS
jgi:hypothetical protein